MNIRMFHIKYLPNAIIRIITGDKYYVCDDCNKYNEIVKWATKVNGHLSTRQR